MTTIQASETRIPPEAFNQVAYQGRRIRITRRGSASVYLISEQDLKLLEQLEDRYWAEEGKAAVAEFEASGQKPVSWEQTKKKLGL